MNIARYNELCIAWHNGKRDDTLGGFLMHHLGSDIVDNEIAHCEDKSLASKMFFSRYVVTSPNGRANQNDHSNFYFNQTTQK